ncbi:MAG: NAD(P)-dependent oxidoreductase, partial [Pseudomonadota bacterium]
MDTRQKIGWLGLGSLGVPCIRRLAEHGARPRVWARNPDLRSELSAEGFSFADSACDLARSVDVIFLSLSDEVAMEEVVFGEGRVVSGLKPGSLLVDCSTISPESTQRFARRLTDTAKCSWIDAPVSGGAAHVANGELVVMAGGDEGGLDRAQKLMAPLCKRFTRLGPVGSGQTLKACIQLVTGATVQALAEGLSVIEASGLNPET